jgi:subtilisin family serine protease
MLDVHKHNNVSMNLVFLMRKPVTKIRSPAGSVLSVSVIFVLLLFSHWLYAAPPAELPHVIPSSYIVVFNEDVDVDMVANELKGRFNLSVGFRYRHALRGMAVKMPERLLTKLAADPRVAYIEQDVVLRTAAQILPTGIDRIDGELNPAAQIDGVDVLADRINVDIAILDTGIDLDHPDLNVFSYTYCKQQGPVNANCVDNDEGANDIHGHGTHVAGTTGAIDNTINVVGVAPGARLWAVKVLEDDGFGSGAQSIAGVDYVTQHAADIEVANMSLTGDGTFQALDDAISAAVAAGVTFTLAAGNDRVDVSTVSPAGHPDAITVSAFEDFDGIPGGLSGNTQDDTFAGFSNRGAGVDIMAPGRTIRSTKAGGGTINMNGTSMAAPHVAGAAALYLSQNPGVGPASVKTALLDTADYTPCANSADGTCADDTDGIQEPLLMYKNLANGDLTGDGLVDARDLLLGWQAINGDTILGDEQLNRGDVAPLVGGVPESDGNFNLGDMLVIYRIINGDVTL